MPSFRRRVFRLHFFHGFDLRPRRRAPRGETRADYSAGVNDKNLSSRRCRKSVLILRTLLDYECAIETSEVDPLIARARIVVPYHNVAFQPTLRDDADDHAAIIGCLRCAEVHREGVFRANEAVLSLNTYWISSHGSMRQEILRR